MRRMRQMVDLSSFVRFSSTEKGTENSSRQPQRFAVNIRACHSTMAFEGKDSVSSQS